MQSGLQYVPLSEEGETTIYLRRYSKDVHRTECQALTITRLTHHLYTTKIARIKCYTMLSTTFKCQDVQHTMPNQPFIKINSQNDFLEKIGLEAWDGRPRW